MRSAAIYARVSTDEQDVTRQLEECREHIGQQFPAIEDVDVFADIISGAAEDSGEQYRSLWDAIETDDYDLVVVHELSRLSRLGAGEIHRFIQHCLEYETAIESLDIGLSIHVDDPRLQQTVYTMIANIMGDLAKIEHQQKLDRIQSGIRAAQQAGTWTGRPPRGFTVGEDQRLHVEPAEFLETRAALERIARGESKHQVARDTGIPRSTLVRFYENEQRRRMYLAGEGVEDDRLDAALEELRPLSDPAPDTGEGTDASAERIRAIVREELDTATE
jgi:DNA invertase Pin-like site-specific DNA recombinase